MCGWVQSTVLVLCIVDSLSTMHAVLSVDVCVYMCIGMCKYSTMYIQ